MQETLNFENMEMDIDGMFTDWNEDDLLANMSNVWPFDDSSLAGFHDAMDSFSFEFDPLQTQNIEGPVTDLAAPAPAPAPTPVPPPAVVGSVVATESQVQITEPTSHQVGMMLEGGASSAQGHDVTQTGFLTPFSDMQIEKLLALQDMGALDEQTPNNPLWVPNVNNNFGGNNNQLSPYPALFHPNPVLATGSSSGQFVTKETPAQFPLQNHISNSHAAWNSRPERNQFSAPNVYGSQYALDYARSPQPFTALQNQVDHATELQQIYDLQAQNSMLPAYPTYPGSEQYSSLQSAFATMQINPYQQGYEPVLPKPAAPASAPSLANYGQQPSLFAPTSNAFGSGSSVTPASPAPNSRDHSSTKMTKETSLHVPYSREAEISHLMSLLSVHQGSTSSANIVPIPSNQETLPESAEGELSLSDGIQRILGMNPERSVTHNAPYNRYMILQNGRVRYEPPRRGRPPKRRELPDEFSRRGKAQKVSSAGGKVGTTATSQAAIPRNPSFAPREFVNTVYDLQYERDGAPIDPHLRLFKPPPPPPPPGSSYA